jgi:hypothetical protein
MVVRRVISSPAASVLTTANLLSSITTRRRSAAQASSAIIALPCRAPASTRTPADSRTEKSSVTATPKTRSPLARPVSQPGTWLPDTAASAVGAMTAEARKGVGVTA